MADEVLKVTKERVRKAAANCAQAEKVLTQLFPEAFEPQDNRVLVNWGYKGTNSIELEGKSAVIEPRRSGNLRGSIYLPYNVVWTLERDMVGHLCLVARPWGWRTIMPAASPQSSE